MLEDFLWAASYEWRLLLETAEIDQSKTRVNHCIELAMVSTKRDTSPIDCSLGKLMLHYWL